MWELCFGNDIGLSVPSCTLTTVGVFQEKAWWFEPGSACGGLLLENRKWEDCCIWSSVGVHCYLEPDIASVGCILVRRANFE